MRLLKSAYHHGDLRNALIQGALKLMEKDGESFSLRDLAKRVGVSAPALYSHFADKETLLVAVAVAGFNQMADELQAAIGAVADPERQFVCMGQAYVQFGMDNPALYKLMFSGEELPAKRFKFPELQEAGNRCFQALSGMLAEMQKSGFMRPGHLELDSFTIWAHVHGLASLIITGRVECMSEQVEGMPVIPMEQLVDLSLKNLLLGFRPAA
jgi:AcrR family transcriptional regulator